MKAFIRQRIRELDRWSADHDNHDQIADCCESNVREVRKRAQQLGLAGVVAACQRRKPKRVSNLAFAREVLAACLTACPHDCTVAEAAQQLGVSKETIYAACCDGRLPHTRIGRRIVITPEQLSQYRQAGEVELPHLA